MGRRLNISQPAVINTELAPLDDSFYLSPSGQLEQWYYDNSSSYAPNRHTTPLTITPMITAFDPDANRSYTPSFSAAPRWYVREYSDSAGTYIETEITGTSDGQNVEYYKSGNTLKVKKNVSYTRAVQIRCMATYIDPRDAGLTHSVEETVTLSTNRDASVIYPTLDVINPSTRAFNPLVDNTSTFTFTAKAKKGNTDVTNQVYFVWYAISGTVEVLANTMPWYVSGQNTETLTVDAMYGEEIKLVLRAKESSSAANLYPDKVYRSVLWQIPDIDCNVISEGGAAIRSTTKYLDFSTVVNLRKDILTDQKKAENLRFNWKYRKNNQSATYDLGWGERIRVDANTLRNVNGSSNSAGSAAVYPIVYVLGAFEQVTHNGVAVMHNDATVVHRYVD